MVAGNCTIFDGTLSTSCNLPVVALFRATAECRLTGADVFVVSVGMHRKIQYSAAKPEIHVYKYTYTNIHSLAICGSHTIRVGYTTVWSGIYECNEYIPLQTVV